MATFSSSKSWFFRALHENNIALNIRRILTLKILCVLWAICVFAKQNGVVRQQAICLARHSNIILYLFIRAAYLCGVWQSLLKLYGYTRKVTFTEWGTPSVIFLRKCHLPVGGRLKLVLHRKSL